MGPVVIPPDVLRHPTPTTQGLPVDRVGNGQVGVTTGPHLTRRPVTPQHAPRDAVRLTRRQLVYKTRLFPELLRQKGRPAETSDMHSMHADNSRSYSTTPSVARSSRT